MSNTIIRLFIALLFISTTLTTKAATRLLIYGGVGDITSLTITPQQEREYKKKLTEALQAGNTVLKAGGSSVNAVKESLKVLENSPLFNAGRGAVFTQDETNELDASIMNGETLQAGAVAGVKRVKNPIYAAQLVMTESPHILFTSSGADAFVLAKGVEQVEPNYFRTDYRLKQLTHTMEMEQRQVERRTAQSIMDDGFGAIGAVALDQEGNLAAGTSTGGVTNKPLGQVSSAAIIGAGIYADNSSVAVAVTGSDDVIISSAASYNIAAQIKYRAIPLDIAARNVLNEIKTQHGQAGLIILDRFGNYAIEFNTRGMFRGVIDDRGKVEVNIYN